jgi:HSP20 family protein
MSLLSLTPFFTSAFDNSFFDCVDYHATSFIDENGLLTLEVDLPGFKKEDVNLSVKERLLEIKAERKNRKLCVERKYSLPKNVDTDKLHAKMEDGVLQVIIPSKVQGKEKIKLIKIE